MTEVFITLTEVFPCFFLSCKANARGNLAKTGHGPDSSILVCICVVRLLCVLFYVLFVCKCVLTPGDNPIAVNKYIINMSKATGFTPVPEILLHKHGEYRILSYSHIPEVPYFVHKTQYWP